MRIFSNYPLHLVEKAVDPLHGLPGLHDFPPTMKQANEFLAPLHREEVRLADLRARLSRPRLPEPERDEAAEQRIKDGLKELVEYLKSGFSPSTAS